MSDELLSVQTQWQFRQNALHFVGIEDIDFLLKYNKSQLRRRGLFITFQKFKLHNLITFYVIVTFE